ncbi:acetolactate synthase-1/2/3 large subunit [Lentibacillus persicus]|uniref:Acetolactate synthase-1/2/3 large subunit n=1 Tax=Lentibacillus persicus TaxID=640948 RepID=A0A1I1ZFC0_9BACI|nr:thiamine pyrophosphate-dependent enzyme [Lentibacillus persicus]SFE29243.1 acetolactate synthase-1/2/3 large subunit [Lentibacillus persicus]
METGVRTRKTVTGGQAIVECMKIEGVRECFCVPGESYLPLLDALYDEESINLIAARHESGAAFMAEGYAKRALKPGIVMATRGVGASNLSIGVHTAYQDSTPMVVFLGQVHSKNRGREGFQEIDLDQYFGHIAKWAVEVKDAARIAEITQRAFRIAKTGRPGPVVVSLPEDILPRKAEMVFSPATVLPQPVPAKEEINHIKQLLSAAKKPLIIAGGGVKSAGAEEKLITFAEAYHLPVVAAFRRQDVFPNHHPLYAGHLGLGTNPRILKTVEEADTILAIGTRLSEVTTQDYEIITPEKKLIHVDISFETIGKVFAPDAGIVADAGEALQALTDIGIQTSWQTWADERRRAFEEVSSLDVSHKDTIYKHIVALMEDILPDDAFLTNDAGNFAGWLHAYYPFKNKQTYTGPTSGAMGYGLPSAIGAKRAEPGKPVIALAGDGGFMMTMQELETAVRYQIPVISIVFNNQMYGTIRMHQEMNYPEKVIGTDLGKVSFKGVAESVGADGYLTNTPNEFAKALKQALSKNAPAVIEIMTEKEQISVSSTISQLRDRAENKE